MMTMDELTAFCGVSCSECTDYKTGKCPGCRKSTWQKGEECPPVSCCGRQSLFFCGDCGRFPCKMMREFYDESDSHRRAYERIMEYRENRKESGNG